MISGGQEKHVAEPRIRSAAVVVGGHRVSGKIASGGNLYQVAFYPFESVYGDKVIHFESDALVARTLDRRREVWRFQVPDKLAPRIFAADDSYLYMTSSQPHYQDEQFNKTVWKVSNDDLPGAPIKDACGAQRLENGNTVITSYGAGGPDDIKLFEITPDKKVVWTLYTGRPHGIHEFQILDADSHPFNGKWIR